MALEPHFESREKALVFCKRLMIGMELDENGVVTVEGLTLWYIRHFKEQEDRKEMEKQRKVMPSRSAWRNS